MIQILLDSWGGGGVGVGEVEVAPEPARSWLPSVQNNPHTEKAHLGVTHSELLHLQEVKILSSLVY